MDVPPIVRDEFLYQSTLIVDVGGPLKRHPRAPESELKLLLDGKAPKDQVSHYYEAQLLHYGLPRSKDKNTAKVRLQQALAKGALKAPPKHLVELEAQMRKEYVAAVRKAKASGGDGGGGGESGGKKRKNEAIGAESAKKAKVSGSAGGDITDTAPNVLESTTKKPSTARKTSAKAVAEEANGDEVTLATKWPVEGTKPKGKKLANPTATETASPARKSASKTTKALESQKDSAVTDKGKGKAAAKINPEPDLKPTSKAKPGPKVKPEPKGKAEPDAKSEPKSKAEPKVKSESEVKSEPKSKPEPKVKSESMAKPEPKVKRETPIKQGITISRATRVKSKPDEELDPMDIDIDPVDLDSAPHTYSVTGVYPLSVPQLAEQLPDQAENFRLFLAVDNGIIWGGFELGMKSGVIRIDEAAVGRPISFGWRARDAWAEEGRQLKFGKKCFGEIEIFENKEVKGVFHNLFNEPMDFVGKRRMGPLWCGRTVASFQKEWDGYVSEAYGR